MQKSQLEIHKPYITLQATYNGVHIALARQHTILTAHLLSKIEASASLIPTLNELLSSHSLTLADISCIGVNQGPAPFTTLRTVVVTANGINFATRLPLIGINALDALLWQEKSEQWPHTVVLLHAFGNEVYFADSLNGQQGCISIGAWVDKYASQDTSLRLIGNGVIKYHDLLKSSLGPHLYIPDSIPDYCSLETIVNLTYQSLRSHHYSHSFLDPLYLKPVLTPLF